MNTRLLDTDEVESDTFAELLRDAAAISGPAATGLGLRLKPGDLLHDGRLRIVRRIGDGGMGVVYQAFDQTRQGLVALKTLSRLDAENIYRLKSEFRSLADVTHPNLCRLFELFTSADDWFFTMELVDGVRFDHWLGEARPRSVDEARLRAAFAQLIAAVGAVHGAGKLHRDIKPSNVLVGADGRVVVLDFGLVADPEPGGAGQTLIDGRITGTPAYMAPEQAAGLAAGAESDLYAVGVMLYEALCGKLPFVGTAWEMVAAKQREEPASVAQHSQDAPADLIAICDKLLHRRPAERPTLSQLQTLFAHEQTGAYTFSPGRLPTMRPSDPGPLRPEAPLLIGREREVKRLTDAYAASRAGRPTLVRLSGSSGVGKSAVVAAFLGELEQSGEAVVLAGRCYERESVPFKGFDALVDDLSRYLRRLLREQAAQLIPRDVFALARVFPVLERVSLIAEAPVKVVEDPLELRRRAFAAFGECVGRIRDRKPLCIFIDDLQWLDADSALLLRALLVEREPAPVLLLVSHRSEGAVHDELLNAVFEVARANARWSLDELAIEPLTDADATRLALQALPTDLPERETLAQGIAREAGGSPFFVTELARHTVRTGGLEAGVSLSAVLAAHLSTLTRDARDLLELCAVAGQPVFVDVLLSASGARYDALDDLRVRHLIRLSGVAHAKCAECFHDRIREFSAAQLSPSARRARFAALAEALLATQQSAPEVSEPEFVANCLKGAGQDGRAAPYAALAAARAEQGMAFDRAAALYREALQLGRGDDPNRRRYRVALADALANAGRAREAADAFLAAAEGAPHSERIDLRRRAADELVGAGYAAQGAALIREVCSDVGVKMPSSHGAALLAFGLSQARIRLAGTRALSPPEKVLTASERQRLDVMQSASRLSVIDPVYGAWAGDQYLLLGLAAGDPAHLARALALQGYAVTVFTPKAESRIALLFAEAERAAARAGARDLSGTVAMWQGSGVIFGRAVDTARCRALLLRAQSDLRGCRGVRSETDTTNLYLLWVLSDDLAYEARRTAKQVEEAMSLGRIWTAAIMAAFSALPRLMVGDESAVTRDLAAASAMWKPEQQTEMQWVDICILFGVAQLANYRGAPEQTLAAFDAAWAWFAASPLRRSAVSLALMHGFRGTAALATARRSGADGAAKHPLLERATRDQKAIEKLDGTIYDFLSLALRTGLHLQAGRRALAVEALRRYLAAARPSPLLAGLDQHAAQRRLGQLVGGEEGRTLLATADAAMSKMGVVDLERTTELVLPGSAAAYPG